MGAAAPSAAESAHHPRIALGAEGAAAARAEASASATAAGAGAALLAGPIGTEALGARSPPSALVGVVGGVASALRAPGAASASAAASAAGTAAARIEIVERAEALVT